MPKFTQLGGDQNCSLSPGFVLWKFCVSLCKRKEIGQGRRHREGKGRAPSTEELLQRHKDATWNSQKVTKPGFQYYKCLEDKKVQFLE